MAKKANLISIPLHDLLETLVAFSASLEVIPSSFKCVVDDKAKVNKRSFVLDTPRQKLDAIETILFGDEKIKLKRGNKSFERYDKKLLYEVKKEQGAELRTKDALLNACVPLAQLRSITTDDESIRSRLEKVYHKCVKENWRCIENYDYGDFSQDGLDDWEQHVLGDICILSPWLDKYKKQILQYYQEN